MSGCDLNDVPARRGGRHRKRTYGIAPSVHVAAFLLAAGAASGAAFVCAMRSNPLGWLFLAAAVVNGFGAAVADFHSINFRLRSLTPHTPAAAGDERGRGSVSVLRVTDAGGRALVGRGVERRGLRYRLLEARALRFERRTGWAAARRARTTPIDDE